MKLSYRGVHYEYTPPTLEMTEGEIAGKYRGQPWKCQTLQEMPVPQPMTELKYRGVSYRRVASARPSLADQVTRVACVVPPVSKTPKVLEEFAQVHRKNLYRNLERRIQVARAKGDYRLVSLLEAERLQLV